MGSSSDTAANSGAGVPTQTPPVQTYVAPNTQQQQDQQGWQDAGKTFANGVSAAGQKYGNSSMSPMQMPGGVVGGFTPYQFTPYKSQYRL